MPSSLAMRARQRSSNPATVEQPGHPVGPDHHHAIGVADHQIPRLDRDAGASDGGVDAAAEPLVRAVGHHAAGKHRKARLADFFDIADAAVDDQGAQVIAAIWFSGLKTVFRVLS